MRLICTINDSALAQRFSDFLHSKGIKNTVDAKSSADWGKDSSSESTFQIWVIDEDYLKDAHEYYDRFLEQPEAPEFQLSVTRPLLGEFVPKGLGSQQSTGRQPPPPPPSLSQASQGKSWRQRMNNILTFYLIAVCSLLFIATEMNSSRPPALPSYIPGTVVVSSPLKKLLLFDYPHAFDIADKLIRLYGLERLTNTKDLPKEGDFLLNQYMGTPFWKGAYREVLEDPSALDIDYDGPIFEKIKEGQWWRLITPCFLHADIFHLFFNMIWLAILGSQIETRLGKLRFIALIVLAGVTSNTAQYLMSGFNFLGFSGVVCAMIAYVYIRQRRAPWEGYLIQKATLLLVTLFVAAMAGIQILSFFLQIFSDFAVTPGIANTAHLVGAGIGYLLGRFNILTPPKIN